MIRQTLLVAALALLTLPSTGATVVAPTDYVAAGGAELLLVGYPDGTTHRAGFSLDEGCIDASLGKCDDIVVPLEHGGPAEGQWDITVVYDHPYPLGGTFSARFVIGDWAAWDGGPVIVTATCTVPTQSVHWLMDYESQVVTATCDGAEAPHLA